MKTQTQKFPKVSVQISRSGEVIIIRDEMGYKMFVNMNLMKHVLGVPFTKKDGTQKTVADICADKERARQRLMAVMQMS